MTLFIIYLVGFLVAIIFEVWLMVREEDKIDLSDIGYSILIGLFSWLGVIFLMIINGDKFVIWRKTKNG